MSQSIISSKTMRNGPHSDCCATWVAQGQQREEVHQYAKILIMPVLPWAQYFFLFFFFPQKKRPPLFQCKPCCIMLSKDLCYKAPCTPATSQPWVYLLLSLIQKLGTLIYTKKNPSSSRATLKTTLKFRNSENQGMCITTADCTHKCPRNMPTKPVSHRRASPQTQRCHMQHCLHLYSHSDIQ